MLIFPINIRQFLLPALALAYLFILSACETVVDVNLPVTPPKLVVNSYFQPDSTIRVHVSQSASILDNANLQVVDDAVVRVGVSNGASELLAYEGNGYYRSTSTPRAGQLYEIEVAATGFETVKSSNRIPAQIDLLTVDTGSVRIDGIDYVEFYVRFEDEAGADHYNVWMESLGFYIGQVNGEPDTTFTREPFPFVSNDLVFGTGEDFTELSYFDQEASFEDALFDGSSYSLRVLVERGRIFGYDPWGGEPIDTLDGWDDDYYGGVGEIRLSLRRVTYDYYLYTTSYSRALFVNGNPFAQPVQVHNNIEGGFGIFAGYTEDYEILNFE